MIAYLVEVDVHALKLKLGGTVVAATIVSGGQSPEYWRYSHAIGVKAVLAGDVLPEGSTDLVALMPRHSLAPQTVDS